MVDLIIMNTAFCSLFVLQANAATGVYTTIHIVSTALEITNYYLLRKTGRNHWTIFISSMSNSSVLSTKP